VLVALIRQAPQDFNPGALNARRDDEQMLVQLPDGSRVALPYARVKPILLILGELYLHEKQGNSLRLPMLDAARIAELAAATDLRWIGGERQQEFGRKLTTFGGVAVMKPPAGLKAKLRDYQKEGVAWMQFLREYHLAGILADDMGLGKTLQTLTHILIEKNQGRLKQPALVVAPTSLMDNWASEARRFTPKLKVLVLHGPEREQLFEAIPEVDLVLTTYALLPRDEERLRQHTFHLLILDEAQYIKNPQSKAAQTASLINATHRLCLTGTPIQNHLGELWSQFHFLMPGLLGDAKSFTKDFRTPIEKSSDSQRQSLLTRRIRPFLLRRTKDKVAKELPPKTEIIRHLELQGAQRDLYETVRLAMDKKVRDEISKKGIARSQIVILDALLKLRQVCCDPRLVKLTALTGTAKALQKTKAIPSAKLDGLLDMVDELLDEGRKILIFSQFTSMLALIEVELQKKQISYALLTGDTVERGAEVRRFQDGEVPLFLISLKAGGVGLNLTAADTVIHYDPWWNPAAENQATDRAWRIGQDKPVFVYRLIAKGSLEEKILAMQDKKADLARAMLDHGDVGSIAFTTDDLQGIFAPLA
jgi:SNF2 family DNA or RNA helicase